MFPSILKNKWFWIVWLILMLAGALIGRISSNRKAKNLKNAQNAQCVEFREVKTASIIAISRLDYKSEYLQAMMDTSIKTLDIPFVSINNGQSVKVLGYTSDSLLANIAIIRDNPTSTKPPYEELWIFEKYIQIDK